MRATVSDYSPCCGGSPLVRAIQVDEIERRPLTRREFEQLPAVQQRRSYFGGAMRPKRSRRGARRNHLDTRRDVRHGSAGGSGQRTVEHEEEQEEDEQEEQEELEQQEH